MAGAQRARGAGPPAVAAVDAADVVEPHAERPAAAQHPVGAMVVAHRAGERVAEDAERARARVRALPAVERAGLQPRAVPVPQPCPAAAGGHAPVVGGAEDRLLLADVVAHLREPVDPRAEVPWTGHVVPRAVAEAEHGPDAVRRALPAP